MDSLPMKMLSARGLSLIVGTIAAIYPVNNLLMQIALRPAKKGAGLSRLCATLASAAGKRSSLTMGIGRSTTPATRTGRNMIWNYISRP